MSLHPHHLIVTLFILVGTGAIFCQDHPVENIDNISSTTRKGALPLDTESNVHNRFVAVHGRRSLVEGYSSNGLEIWAYPFQLLSGYRVSFRVDGTTTSIRGDDVLRRITYTPDSITRIYVGSDFEVREKIFVPLEEPAAIFTYQVRSLRSINIEVHAIPVLDLMWPAGIGGQNVAWDGALSAYVLSEPASGYMAVAGSPDLVAHDDVGNRTVQSDNDSSIGFTLRPDDSESAHLFVALNTPHETENGTKLRQLIRDRAKLEADASAHYDEFSAHAMRIETPDPKVNQALAWSETALDQAWVCNPQLGCGIVAGYGPSRMSRRPQYAWFFAGDGLVAADALVSEGEYARAREELVFIFRWQDAKTGMIWHELSQSAGFLDWVGKYPYMYAHVDITFQFLGTLERYMASSGDAAFAIEHWSAIEAAYAYCRSLIDSTDGLPRIPSNRTGGDEQDRESDDLGLSVSWVSASRAFARLATLTGHPAEAQEAMKASAAAGGVIAGRYWDSEHAFWIQGHTSAGQVLPELRSSPAGALAQNIFSTKQSASILDQLASSSFQTDWGTRTVGEGSAAFDSESYAKGSVFAIGTAESATAFWSAHRPVTALQVWSSMLALFSLDSLGHVHEVLSGNRYRPQIESVPEQTWSSAGFLDSTVHGLLGLEVNSLDRRVVFAPHLPPVWNDVSITNIWLSDASMGLSLHRAKDGFVLKIENSGKPFHIEFAPQLPLGSSQVKAEVNHKPIAAALRINPQDEHARLEMEVAHGNSELHLSFTDGVSVDVPSQQHFLGDVSVGVQIVSASLADRVLTIVADVPQGRSSRVVLHTRWTIANGQVSDVRQVSDDTYELIFRGQDLNSGDPSKFVRATAKIQFSPAR